MVTKDFNTNTFEARGHHSRSSVNPSGKHPKMRGRKFNYGLNYKLIDFSRNPELYQVGKGEQGVLLVEPYKSQICPHWRFREPRIALESARKIYDMFLDYLLRDDFVGADMARKFLMMGWTRSLRYANHHDGRKYDKDGGIIPQESDWKESKYYESSRMFKKYFDIARANEKYLKMKKDWIQKEKTR